MGAGIEQRPWTPTVRRGKIGAETASPGPACVQLPGLVATKVADSKKKAAPAFSMGHKYRSTDASFGPGPAQYNVSGLGAKGKDTQPAASLQSRPKELTKYQTPAPGEYDVCKATNAVTDSTPKYTFGQRPKPNKLLITPAPNVYRIPSLLGVSKEGPIRSAPAFSITGREKFAKIPGIGMPGPGQYDAQYFAIKRKPPMYSMSGKYKLPADHERKPGPGAYCSEKYVEGKCISAFSFGIRHSENCGQRRTYLIPDCHRKKAAGDCD